VPKDPSAAWKVRYHRWLRYVRQSLRVMEAGKPIPLGPSSKPLVAPSGPSPHGKPIRVVLCSPHPDDEALIGALALRLRLECGAAVTNCAITLGSNADRRAGRRRELDSACQVLGFNLVIANPPWGFERVTLHNRQNQPEEWAAKVQALSQALEREEPDVVFAPHAEDFNTTHVGTHYLVMEALGACLARTGRGPLPFIETEFWHANPHPNLMIGVSAEVEATLIMAAAEHGGEVARNPYHLRHLGRMIDNVRLGSEVVGGQGGPAYAFPFAELYRVAWMFGKELTASAPGGRVIGPEEKIDFADLLKHFWPKGR